MNRKLVSEWQRQLIRDFPAWNGGWWMVLVCAGGKTHAPQLISHVFAIGDAEVSYSAPPGRVQQTRLEAAVGVPGQSRESVRFVCPKCSTAPLVSRARWGEMAAAARCADLRWLDLSDLDRRGVS